MQLLNVQITDNEVDYTKWCIILCLMLILSLSSCVQNPFFFSLGYNLILIFCFRFRGRSKETQKLSKSFVQGSQVDHKIFLLRQQKSFENGSSSQQRGAAWEVSSKHQWQYLKTRSSGHYLRIWFILNLGFYWRACPNTQFLPCGIVSLSSLLCSYKNAYKSASFPQCAVWLKNTLGSQIFKWTISVDVLTLQ